MKSITIDMNDVAVDDHVDLNYVKYAQVIKTYIVTSIHMNVTEIYKQNAGMEKKDLYKLIIDAVNTFMGYIIGIILRDHKSLYEINGGLEITVIDGKVALVVDSEYTFSQHYKKYISKDFIYLPR